MNVADCIVCSGSFPVLAAMLLFVHFEVRPRRLRFHSGALGQTRQPGKFLLSRIVLRTAPRDEQVSDVHFVMLHRDRVGSDKPVSLLAVHENPNCTDRDHDWSARDNLWSRQNLH